MRNRMREQVTRTVLRVGTTAVAVVAGIAALTATASAATSQLAAPSTTPFGMLGPVGIVAVAVGGVGMIAGLARRRREALARAVASRSVAADHTTAERAARVSDARDAEQPAEPSCGQRIPAPSRPPAVERTGPLPAVQGTRAA